MASQLNGRKVYQFRCQIDPMIPPGPKNAFCVGQSNIASAELTPAGVYVQTAKEKLEFLIPYANIQSIKLVPEAPKEKEEKKEEKK